ncbi:MAG: carboxypeptidase regulatory-like domain-containing protein, partial [Candidatus Promineifilaceae bacterium]
MNAPAAYTETLAVGAVDETGSTTWFSARGPSSFTSDPKPTIVAPGAFVISAKPGGEYAVRDGTSMSAPHVSGLLALLLSGEENLSEVDLARIITSSAKALDQPIPSSESGWGRIDAFDAVAAIMPTGRVEGNVSGSTGVIPNASVTITPPAGTSITITTDSAGNYSIHLLPGSYQVEAGVFGFEAEVIDSVLVITDEVTRVDFELERMPFGTVHGSVTDSSTRAVSETVIEVSGTPLSVATNQLGEYSISIPSGSYTLTARSTGYFIRRLGVQIDASSNIDLDFHLDAAAKALLVDSGAWYYRSQIDFYTSALDEYGLAYDTLSIRNPYNDVPGSEDLADYEIVLWSSPTDSPVALSAGEVISNYLGHGGNLLISGQNVAEYDDELIFERSWWSYHFGASYIGSKTPPITIAGYPESLFDPQPILLNEPGSAGNQEATDVMAIDAGSFSEPAFQYQDGSIAALQAGSCAPFEAISLGFGLEGVASVEQRARIIADSMEYFSRPDREVGVRLIPNEQPHLVAPGYSVTMTFQVLNRSEIFTDTFSFFVEDNIWPVQVLSKTHTLGSCQWGTITATVDVPSGLASDTR